MDAETYRSLLYPQRNVQSLRMRVRLRGFLCYWIIFVAGVFAPPIWLAAFAVPLYLRRYERRINRSRSSFAQGASIAEAMYYRGGM